MTFRKMSSGKKKFKITCFNAKFTFLTVYNRSSIPLRADQFLLSLRLAGVGRRPFDGRTVSQTASCEW